MIDVITQRHLLANQAVVSGSKSPSVGTYRAGDVSLALVMVIPVIYAYRIGMFIAPCGRRRCGLTVTYIRIGNKE